MRSDDELHAPSGPALRDRTRALVAERNRIDAELARTVRVADSTQAFAADGMAAAGSWLRGHSRLSKAAASQVVRTGRALEQLPAVEEAHAAGSLTADQVDEIATILAPRPVALAARTTDGKTKKDVIRCLKRALGREIYRALITDLEALHRPTNQLQPAA